MGQEASPSAAVLDSPSVKSAERGQYPTTKQVMRPEIHVLLDSEGLPVRVVVLLRRDPGRFGRAGPRPDTQARSPGRTDLGRWRYDEWQVEAAVVRRIGSTKWEFRQDFENFAKASAKLRYPLLHPLRRLARA
jgi:hypothetical protein